MVDNKKPNTASEFLDRVTEFLSNFEDRNLQELKEDLRLEGVDPDRIVTKVQLLVETKLKEHKLAWKHKAELERLADLDRLKKIKSEQPKSKQELQEKISAILQRISGSRPQVPAEVFYRKFEEATENDLKTLLEDLQRLQLLEDSTNKHNEEIK